MPPRTRTNLVRRIAVRVVVFVLLGAMVNVAVAWVCAIWSPIDFSESAPMEVQPVPPFWWTDYPVWFENGFLVTTFDCSSFGLRATAVAGDPLHSLILRSGWPLASFEHAVELDPNAVCRPHRAIAVPAFLSPTDPNKAFVPTHVLPLGFATDTVILGAIVWVLVAIPFALRRRRRTRRGLCARCAYPVGASDVCTECGARVKVGSQRVG